MSVFSDIQLALRNINQPPCKKIIPIDYLEYLVANYISKLPKHILCYDRHSLIETMQGYLFNILKECYPQMTDNVVKYWLYTYISDLIPEKLTIESVRRLKQHLKTRTIDLEDVIKMSSTPKQCIEAHEIIEPSEVIRCSPCSGNVPPPPPPKPEDEEEDVKDNNIV